jgi:hypothetical protein
VVHPAPPPAGRDLRECPERRRARLSWMSCAVRRLISDLLASFVNLTADGIDAIETWLRPITEFFGVDRASSGPSRDGHGPRAHSILPGGIESGVESLSKRVPGTWSG